MPSIVWEKEALLGSKRTNSVKSKILGIRNSNNILLEPFSLFFNSLFLISHYILTYVNVFSHVFYVCVCLLLGDLFIFSVRVSSFHIFLCFLLQLCVPTTNPVPVQCFLWVLPNVQETVCLVYVSHSCRIGDHSKKWRHVCFTCWTLHQKTGESVILSWAPCKT